MASSVPVLTLVFVLFTTFYHLGDARLIIVGGTLDGWKVPEPANNTLNHWAESVRFKVGDILIFYYGAKNDSVLQVTKENYESCKTEKPLKEYKEGNSKVTLEVSGPHYFISGAPTGNCGKGEKLTVVVQSPNHQPHPKTAPAPGAAPSTSPSTSPVAPAPAPSSAVGSVAGNGFLWALVAVIGLVWA
ncbi:unnamed protein product [Microthlaspi erraticum]|uniref:Phytocyanin domain-containing protein n=1 Tax=Microthlaspi erraticum TaxID=1685480 RepID=A0A6D2J7W6_9BRAS|nr:unnamed protein product [Microthlaspi erraticum]